MNSSDRLTLAYEQFIEFGQMLDRRMRQYLVQYLQHKFQGSSLDLPQLKEAYFDYFKSALDDLAAIPHLHELLGNQELLQERLILDTLRWLRKTYQKVKTKHPYQQEMDRLGNWAITPVHVFYGRWSVLVAYLEQNYAKEELETPFFKHQFQSLIDEARGDVKQPEDRKKVEMLLNDILAQWDARLHAKILAYQLRQLQEEKETFIELMEAKVQEYQQLTHLLNPFTDYLGWDLSRALWQDASFDLLNKYHELLQNEKSLQELADLLGSMREAEIEIEERKLEKTIVRQEWVKDEFSKAEIVGIKESDDLNNLLSSEISLLASEDTSSLFLKKFVDKGLLTFRYEEDKLVKSEDKLTEIYQGQRRKEKGPFIVCVDTSESMRGRPEQIAKTLTLGILKMAIRENRRAYLINFSIGIKTLDLHDIANSMDELAAFLGMSFYGGTDISLPLYEAVRQLKSENYEDADVLVISDFIMYKVDQRVLDDIKHHQQNKGTQFHSLTLSDEPNTFILEQFDTNWQYNPKEKGIMRALTQELNKLSKGL